MSKRKTLQIDVKGALDNGFMDCRLYVDGRCCTFYMSKSNYEALLYDGIFIRDGKTKDSADVLNTTNVFEEKE